MWPHSDPIDLGSEANVLLSKAPWFHRDSDRKGVTISKAQGLERRVASSMTGIGGADDLGLAWWNTALSPNRKKGRATPDELTHACRVLNELVAAGAALIGLCEISRTDVDHLGLHSALSGYLSSEPGSVVSPLSAFDTCIFYDPARLTLINEADVLVAYGGGQLRVGQRFAMRPVDRVEELHVIISHWPSRNTLGIHDPLRVLYGHALREAVNKLLDPDTSAQIVLMGDYNDEPFSDSIAISLRGSRDRERSLARTDILYNPFWRHMASFQHWGHDPCSDQGTYFYKSGDVSRWHTFDQMMFSNSLLKGSKDLLLDEERTRAYVAPWLDALVQRRDSIFDHRPIVGRLKRV